MAAKDRTDLLQGTLDMLIPKALSLGPMHGDGVGQRIMQLAEDMLRVEEGSLYPALYRLEERGWIASEWAHRRITAVLVSIDSPVPTANNSRWKKRIGSDSCWLSAK
jgi:PadR family transcriptional regulator